MDFQKLWAPCMRIGNLGNIFNAEPILDVNYQTYTVSICCHKLLIRRYPVGILYREGLLALSIDRCPVSPADCKRRQKGAKK